MSILKTSLIIKKIEDEIKIKASRCWAIAAK